MSKSRIIFVNDIQISQFLVPAAEDPTTTTEILDQVWIITHVTRNVGP